MARVVEMKAGFVVHKLKIKCAPPRLFYKWDSTSSANGRVQPGTNGSALSQIAH